MFYSRPLFFSVVIAKTWIIVMWQGEAPMAGRRPLPRARLDRGCCRFYCLAFLCLLKDHIADHHWLLLVARCSIGAKRAMLARFLRSYVIARRRLSRCVCTQQPQRQDATPPPPTHSPPRDVMRRAAVMSAVDLTCSSCQRRRVAIHVRPVR